MIDYINNFKAECIKVIKWSILPEGVLGLTTK